MEASIDAYRKTPSHPVQEGEGIADGFQEGTLSFPLTQVQDSTVPKRCFLRRGHGHDKRSFPEGVFVETQIRTRAR
jgi:hypothetical protein